jgi:c(7)-type cytochrome triheme protein
VPRPAAANFPFPPQPAPEEYGNVLIDRTATAAGVAAVSFSHWQHRRLYTCRVCHFEIQFNFQAGSTEISEEANRAGQYCGTCHDGRELFGHEKPEDCERCHNGDLRHGVEGFGVLWRLPPARYGNQVDWDAALDDGAIDPVRMLTIPSSAETAFASSILLEAVWVMGPDAVFPHGKHTQWLDCNDCHPWIFNIKKKFTEGLEMMHIVEGQFCGVCHGKVAFPLQDCVRCHPGMKDVPSYPEPVSRD